jgi:hypothetical protein
VVATTDTGPRPTPSGGPTSAGAPGSLSPPPAAGDPARESGPGGLIAAAQVAGAGRKPVRKIHWWFEVILAVAGYYVYAYARSAHGHTLRARDTRIAARHGRDLFNFEKAIHLDWERGLQHNLLPYKGFLQVVGGFYGGAHFIVTIGVLVWMLVRRPQFYRFWRTALFALTMTAVGIFVLYPAMPPRLLKDPVTHHTLTVDTLDKVGGLWSYNHGVLEHISDPYAPLPSLHLGWATWVFLALWFTLPARSWRRRIVVGLYPLAVYFTVIATGTHFVIDGVAGMALTVVVVVVIAYVVRGYRRRQVLRGNRHGAGAGSNQPGPAVAPTP